MTRKLYWLVLLTVSLLNFSIVQAQKNEELVVFAAASLTDSFEAIAEAFEQENSGAEILFNFGGSSTLATQLTQGAPADIFASANHTQMQIVIDSERISDTPLTFAKNRLVLIVPANNPANIQSLQDLANPSDIHLILAAPEVPVRAYTDTMLERMAIDSLYGEAYREAVLANVVSEEPNVRQVSAKVALGEADAGIVYLSDVTPDIADDVLTIPVPDSFNTIASYPIAMTNDSTQADLARRFIDFVLSDSGQDILVEWGFVSIRIAELANTITLPTDGTLLVDGQVSNPLSLTAESLRSNFESMTLDVSYMSGDEQIDTTFTGVLLWDVIRAAQPNFDLNVPNDNLSMFIVVTGVDGYQALFSWAEIDPALTNHRILIACEEQGIPLSNLRLIVPSDNTDGRYVNALANISLRNAPSPTNR